MLLTVAVLLPLVFKMDIQVSIVPAVGGVITELIAGTALIIYRNSILQLNHYHEALHEDERFLSSAYKELFPYSWSNYKVIYNKAQLEKELKEFWGNF